MQSKIPNPDIIGYEGPVGHEKALHHTHFSLGGMVKHKGETEWYEYAPGRWRPLPKKREERGAGDEEM